MSCVVWHHVDWYTSITIFQKILLPLCLGSSSWNMLKMMTVSFFETLNYLTRQMSGMGDGVLMSLLSSLPWRVVLYKILPVLYTRVSYEHLAFFIKLSRINFPEHCNSYHSPTVQCSPFPPTTISCWLHLTYQALANSIIGMGCYKLYFFFFTYKWHSV